MALLLSSAVAAVGRGQAHAADFGRDLLGRPMPALSASTAGDVDISQEWRFHIDSQDVGRSKRWDGVSFNDSRWALIDTGGPWEERGARGYDGVGWYRKWVELAEPWEQILIVLPSIADRADLFVNGTRVDKNLKRPHVGTRMIVRDISTYVGNRTRFLIALRITNEKKGEPGGFHNQDDDSAMRLARSARPLFENDLGWFDFLAQQYPRQPWPSWMRNRGAAWVVVGEPEAGGGGDVGLHGQMSPHGQGFTVSWCLYDPRSKRFYSTEGLSCSLRLEGRTLPLPEINAKAGRLFKLKMRHWTRKMEGPSPITIGIGEVTVQNATDRTREVQLILLVHPFGPRAHVPAIEKVSYNREMRTILVNDLPAVVLAGAPHEFGAAGFSEAGSVAHLLARGELPKAQEAMDSKWKLASGAAVYRLRIQPYGARTQTYRVFLEGRPERLTQEMATKIQKVSRKGSLGEMRTKWQRLVRAPESLRLRVRDKKIQYAYYASLSHLYVNLGGMSGTNTGRVSERFSPRDSAIAVSAFLRAGHTRAARHSVSAFLNVWSWTPGGQAPAGREAPGLAIYALSEYILFTQDREFAATAYPAISKACQALEEMRSRRVKTGGGGRTPVGLITDAGEGDEGWNAAWGVAGWRRAERIAIMLGREEDASRMREQGDVSESELKADFILRHGRGELPFGGVTLLWQCAALSSGLPEIRASYNRAWEAWFEQSGGGCRPRDVLLPSAGLAMAHQWAILGEADRARDVVSWLIGTQTVSNGYAWARKVDSRTFRHADGALPDPRAAAEYICLLRDMLLSEDEDTLVLTPALPAEWVRPGRHLEIKQAPTWFGVFPGFSVTSSPRGLALRLMKGSATSGDFSPPGGICWRIPGTRAIRRLTVARQRVSDIPADRVVRLPEGTREVSVVW